MIRILSALVLLSLVIGSVWFLPSWQLLVVAEIVLVLAFVEYAALTAQLGTPIARGVSGTAAVLSCAAMAGPPGPLGAVLLAATIALASVSLTAGPPRPALLHAVAAGLFPSLYLGLPLGALVALDESSGREVVLLLVATVAVSDTAQFYTGSLLGRTPLAPAISPKKTVEGAVGGFVFGTVTLAVVGAWWLPGVAWPWRAALGAIVVATGMLGDLFESMLKRSAGVKDSSGLVPGHGGMLDRIDALLFAAPAYYLFLRYGAW
jgi:phosphatidate cytidylyltransferase